MSIHEAQQNKGWDWRSPLAAGAALGALSLVPAAPAVAEVASERTTIAIETQPTSPIVGPIMPSSTRPTTPSPAITSHERPTGNSHDSASRLLLSGAAGAIVGAALTYAGIRSARSNRAQQQHYQQVLSSDSFNYSTDTGSRRYMGGGRTYGPGDGDPTM